MINVPLFREFIMKNDAGKTKRFKILSRKSAPCCARVELFCLDQGFTIRSKFYLEICFILVCEDLFVCTQ